jgi:hypothetical protein
MLRPKRKQGIAPIPRWRVGLRPYFPKISTIKIISTRWRSLRL